MRFLIMACGKGERLKADGVGTPKALVAVGGEPLMARQLRIIEEVRPGSPVTVICREDDAETAAFLSQTRAQVVTAMTETPLESLQKLLESLPADMADDVAVINVDSVYSPADLRGAVDLFLADMGMDGCFPVTADCSDDEKPLYVATAPAPEGELPAVTGFFDTPCASTEGMPAPYVSGGIYMLRAAAAEWLRGLLADPQARSGRLRDMQRALLAAGFALKAAPFGRMFDIDDAADVARANNLENTIPQWQK